MPDDDVVETLAGDRPVIGDDHVARREPLPAVMLHAVGDDNAKIGYKMRNAADKTTGAIVKPYQSVKVPPISIGNGNHVLGLRFSCGEVGRPAGQRDFAVGDYASSIVSDRPFMI